MSDTKSLESQAIAANDTSSKFLGVSLIFHALLVLLVIYLNYPAIKQKFNPEPEAVAIEVKEPATTTTPAAAPEVAKIEEKKPEPIAAQAPVLPAKPVEKIQAKAEKAIQKARLKISEFKEEELTTTSIRSPAKANKPTTVTQSKVVTEVKAKSTPTKKAATAQNLPQKKTSMAATTEENESEVLVPKATITEISEVPANEDGVPLPNIADEVADSGIVAESLTTTTTTTSGNASPSNGTNLQQMARSELVEETVEENTTSSVTEVRQSSNSGLSRSAPARSEIRAYTALQQRPGNPIPKYSDYERLYRHEGQVKYLAYVTPEGRLTDFILEESSGHSNLDQKTLQALKSWRFVAGQEGWVEIPQIWILSGEAEQLPSQLRR